jgi:regulator of replication initiation timing
MKDNQLDVSILQVEEKLHKLLDLQNSLKTRVSELESENRKLKAELEGRSEKLDNFQNKWKLAKLVEGIPAEKRNTTELKNVISDYIKEIDFCIAQLGK